MAPVNGPLSTQGALKDVSSTMVDDSSKVQKPVVIQIGSRASSLREWDTNGDGVITEDDLIAAAIAHGKMKTKLKNYRHMICLSVLVVLLSLGVMVAAVVIGVEMTKDTSVKDGKLVSSTSGSPVSVNQNLVFKSLPDLFTITWTRLHTIQHVTFYVPAKDQVVFFKVEAIERNSTDLMLYSTRNSDALDITATSAIYVSNGVQYMVQDTVVGAGRRLLGKSPPPPPTTTSYPPPPTTSTGGGTAGTTDSSNTTTQAGWPVPCCP
eukprot:jgi/Mesen1/1837/ME000142S01001